MTIPYQFVELKPINNEIPTVYPSCDWLKELPEYHLSQANVRPVEATTIELGYEIDRLKKDAAFHKQTLIDYQNNTQTHMDDYKNLHMDYLNSQSEVKKLKEKLDFLEGIEEYNLWLMQQYLKVKNQLASVEDKKEVDRTWL